MKSAGDWATYVVLVLAVLILWGVVRRDRDCADKCFPVAVTATHSDGRCACTDGVVRP